MAQFIPSIEKIQQFRVQPTEGEWYLLRFLEGTLDDSYEVYFNPFLNGDRPDVVIMRKGGGVMIIEVKDWDLDAYTVDDKKHWHLKYPKNEGEARAYIKSPIGQVGMYKENLYYLHVEKLLENNIRNPRLWGVVSCGVYFHNASHQQIISFLIDPFRRERGYMKFISNIDLIGRDDLEPNTFKKNLGAHCMLPERNSYFFEDWLYDAIHRLLLPPLHMREQGRYISRYDGRLKKQHPQMLMYSQKQDELIFDKSKRKEWRVKGVVGSGKTTLLAAKAVQAYKELVEQGISNPKILILTYNITLKNFIRDKIQQVQEEFDWSSFTILNYHRFINAQLNNLGIDFRREDGESDSSFFARYYDNYPLFAERKEDTERFDVIFIDEIQDYKRVWMDIIKDCFLYNGGEYPRGGYYLLGDVKQNIYNMRTSDKDVITNVKGVNKLDTCFRSGMKIKDLALGFQQAYFQEKYEVDSSFTDEKDKDLFEGQNLQQGYLNYIPLTGEDPIQSVFHIIEGNIQNRINGVSINDITVLGVEIEFLKLFDTYYRHKTGRKTSTMFETYEQMFLQGIRDKSGFAPSELKTELIQLMGRQMDRTPDAAEKNIAILFSIYELYSRFPETFSLRLESKCKELKCSKDGFIAIMNKYADGYKDFRERVFTVNYKFIRDNKKFYFFMNSGNIKISSIHSFKGWESDTIFLILQQKKEGDPSFDELLYTGITRTISNLIVINLGNTEYHEKMKRLIETYK